ncbi:MAG: hypothetical protein JRJ46_09975 [Deltaproteobacteria bacterium]|nr:hypothetical protein [Deltaproteobacteria bacterium]
MEDLNVVKMPTKKEVLDAEIQKKVNLISGMVKDLKPNELRAFCQQLRDLRQFVHEFEYEMDNVLRILHEDDVETRVRKMRDMGLHFDSIVIDNIRFYINDSGQVTKGFPPGESDEDWPF